MFLGLVGYSIPMLGPSQVRCRWHGQGVVHDIDDETRCANLRGIEHLVLWHWVDRMDRLHHYVGPKCTSKESGVTPLMQRSPLLGLNRSKNLCPVVGCSQICEDINIGCQKLGEAQVKIIARIWRSRVCGNIFCQMLIVICFRHLNYCRCWSIESIFTCLSRITGWILDQTECLAGFSCPGQPKHRILVLKILL